MQNPKSVDKSKDEIFTCKLCNVELPNKASMEQHNGGQKHMKLYNAKEEQRRIEQKCGIYVRGYPNHLGQDVLLSYFSTFGVIVWTHFGSNFLLIDFSEPSAVEKIMNRSHNLQGRRLTIRYRELKNQRPKSDTNLEDTAAVLELLKTSTFLNHQVHTLIQCLQGGMIRTIYHSKYNSICEDLQRTLRYTFPQSCIYPFGSSLTGLYFWNSDVDIYISGIRRDDDEDIGYLFRLKNILHKSHYFSNLIVIGQAKIPILKCIHTPTNTNCDINIRNLLGVCNSKLLNYYITIDPKIKEMMMVIKFWAGVHRITGQNHLFTNYSLCLMILFYLQGNPYHLPSVKYLQGDPHFDVYQEKWNGGFKKMTAYCPHIRSSSLLDLLDNFFTYYSNFDYGSYVICPYLGCPVEKKQFQSPDNLPKYFNAYKEFISIEKNKPLKIEASICVQDPFEHSRNTTPVVSDSTLNIFVKFCRHARKLCQDGEKFLLHKLFTEAPPDVDVELLTQANFTQFGITMGTNVKYLRDKLDTTNDPNSTIKELWFESVKNFTMTVLKDFLNLDVEENGGPSDSKRMKIDGQKDVHSRLGLLITSYKCSGKLNLWHSRKIVLKNTEQELKTVIERESEVTKQLICLYKDINLIENIIEFEIALEKKYEPTQVVFNMTKISSYKKTFRNFGEFFAKKFGNWFELYEKDMNHSA